jgi:hypothetical protein
MNVGITARMFQNYQTHIVVNQFTGEASIRDSFVTVTYNNIADLIRSHEIPAIGRVWIHVE